MSGSVNKVILLGNLGGDPEIRKTQDGRSIANFTMATTESWRDKNTGEKREKTEWHRVVVFSEGLTKVVESYLKKGSKVYIEGQLQTRKWTDQSGQDRYTTEVVLQSFKGNMVLLSPRDQNDGGSSYNQNQQIESSSEPPIDEGGQQSNEGADQEYSDEIPF